MNVYVYTLKRKQRRGSPGFMNNRLIHNFLVKGVMTIMDLNTGNRIHDVQSPHFLSTIQVSPNPPFYFKDIITNSAKIRNRICTLKYVKPVCFDRYFFISMIKIPLKWEGTKLFLKIIPVSRPTDADSDEV